MKTSIYAIAAAALGACGGPGYVYTPEQTNAVTAGMPASRTEIPQEKPEGAISLTSYGITQLRPYNVPALHVRMIVTNDGDDTPWHLQPSKQYVEIAGEGRSAPMYVNSDIKTMPTVTIARHERRVLDFYFPLPATVRSDSQLPHFEVLWQVDTGTRTVASRTAFDRVQTEPVDQYAYGYGYGYADAWPYWAGYGPYWWYDPFYSAAIYVHPRPIIRPSGGRIAVGRFGGHFRAVGPQVSQGGPHHR